MALRDVFYGNNDVVFTFGNAAAGMVKVLPADVALTGSLVRQFQVAVDLGVGLAFEAQLYLNVTGAGIVTTAAGMSAGTPQTRLTQQAQTTATAVEMRSASGATSQSIASSSLATTTKAVLLQGSVLQTDAAGVLFVDVSTAGTVTLLAGSTFRVWRTEN